MTDLLTTALEQPEWKALLAAVSSQVPPWYWQTNLTADHLVPTDE